MVSGARDRLTWAGTADGRFTVSSAYGLLTQNYNHRQDVEGFYKRIWKARIPERIRVFLWLVGNQSLMTDQEIFRRHLTDTPICQVCKSGVESIIHILRDCPAMYGIWTLIVPVRKRQVFFSQTLLEWIHSNLGGDGSWEKDSWSTIFAVAIWWGWKWRCSNIFRDSQLWRDRVGFIKRKASEVTLAVQNSLDQETQAGKITRMIGWTTPRLTWMKLNTDGASRGNQGLVAAGGVLKNEKGEWCGSFALNIERCSAPLTELWGVFYGLVLAWEKRVTRLEVEVDSEVVVGFLTAGISDTHPLSFLSRLCYGFFIRDWIVRVTHVYRKTNHLADGLTNYAFTLDLGLHSFDIVPESLSSIWKDDLDGVARPRQVRV